MTETQVPFNSNPYENRGGHQQTPNSTEVMVLGILSIVFCWCWGLLSLILSIVTIVLANQGERQYRLNPSLYSEASYRNLKTGKTCAIIGLCLAALTIIGVIIYFVVFGTVFYNIFRTSMEY